MSFSHPLYSHHWGFLNECHRQSTGKGIFPKLPTASWHSNCTVWKTNVNFDTQCYLEAYKCISLLNRCWLSQSKYKSLYGRLKVIFTITGEALSTSISVLFISVSLSELGDTGRLILWKQDKHNFPFWNSTKNALSIQRWLFLRQIHIDIITHQWETKTVTRSWDVEGRVGSVQVPS